VLGSLLVVIYAATAAWGRRRIKLGDVALIGCAVVLPFASPYAPASHRLLRRALLFKLPVRPIRPRTGWRPAPSIVTLPFYVLVIGTVFLLRTCTAGTLTLFERITLVILLILLGLEASRGMLWFRACLPWPLFRRC